MVQCMLVKTGMVIVARLVSLPAKPAPGDYIIHEDTVYSVLRCVLRTDDSMILVRVTDANTG